MMVNATLDDYRPLVYQVAHRMRVGKPACVELDDLVQAGMIGLMEARQRFEPSHGATFVGYACSRIQGAMLDELRGNDWMTRRERKLQKDIDQAVCRLQHRHFRAPRRAEIASELGIAPTDYQQLSNADADTGPTSLNELMSGERQLPDDQEDSELRTLEINTADISAEPSAVLQQHQMLQALTSAIALLPQRQQSVMDMYYTQDLNLREIGVQLGVSESRVSQLISKSIAQLRQMLSPWRNDADRSHLRAQ
jgi:RNA polymerase sigma factor FliA